MGLRVLVVDDDRDGATALSFILKFDGHDVKFANSVDEALAITDHEPHCAVFNMQMPERDGVVLARELRRRHGCQICLICMTGLAMDHPKVVEVMAFANHALPKPLNVEWLRELLPADDQPDTKY